METLDYKKDLDQNIAGLVWSLNLFPGINTVSSCGGHKERINNSQWPEGSWYVSFMVDRNDHGWFALEFLAWLINHDYAGPEHHVKLYPDAKPPYLNTPGQMLGFMLEGWDGEDPQALADWIKQMKQELYISPDDIDDGVHHFTDEIEDNGDDIIDDTDEFDRIFNKPDQE